VHISVSSIILPRVDGNGGCNQQGGRPGARRRFVDVAMASNAIVCLHRNYMALRRKMSSLSGQGLPGRTLFATTTFFSWKNPDFRVNWCLCVQKRASQRPW
jgi:hypothetical protein